MFVGAIEAPTRDLRHLCRYSIYVPTYTFLDLAVINSPAELTKCPHDKRRRFISPESLIQLDEALNIRAERMYVIQINRWRANFCVLDSNIITALALFRLNQVVGDVVCSRTGDVGRQALVAQDQEGWLVGTGCLRLRVRGLISASYLTYYLGHPAVRDWVTRNATGSAILSLNTKTLGSMPVVLPPLAVQSVAAEVLGALDEKIAVYDQISRTTAALRDSLLLLLLAGPLGTALL